MELVKESGEKQRKAYYSALARFAKKKRNLQEG